MKHVPKKHEVLATTLRSILNQAYIDLDERDSRAFCRAVQDRRITCRSWIESSTRRASGTNGRKSLRRFVRAQRTTIEIRRILRFLLERDLLIGGYHEFEARRFRSGQQGTVLQTGESGVGGGLRVVGTEQ